MSMLPTKPPVLRIDPCSRILIITVSFFTISALALAIVGILTSSWYYYQDPLGNTQYYNLFTRCIGNVNNGSSACTDIPRQTDLGIGTLHAAAFLIVGICLLGCGMLITLAMNFARLTGILLFVPPILLFFATVFMVATFAEGSRVTIFNGYSAILVQTSHVLTIFSMGIIAFVSGRLHTRYYERF